MSYDFDAIEDIKRLKYAYVRAMDSADLDALSACLTEDAYINYKGGLYTVEKTGRSDIVEFIGASFHENAAASHQVHHPVIDVTGPATARGQWSLQDHYYDVKHRIIVSGASEYVDDYVKRDGRWLIAKSTYTRLYEMTQPMPETLNFSYRKLAETGRKVDGMDAFAGVQN